MSMGEGAGLTRKGLRLGAGGLVLAAGVSLTGTWLFAPHDLFAQTVDSTAPGDFSLGVTEAPPEKRVAPVPPGFTVGAIKVQGNSHVDLATIASYLALPKGKPATKGDLNDAYQRLFGSGLFARVEMVPQGSTLLVKVVENPTIGTVDFQGNARIKDEVLTAAIKSKSNNVYSPAQAEADATLITDIYRVQGRLSATITPRIIRRPDNKVDLVFEIAEGKVAEIARLSFVGNKAFSDYRLRQVLESKQAGILHLLIQKDTYNADRLEVDKKLLSDFYLSRGFLDFKILDAGATYARDRDATFLTFSISEGQSFKIGNITTISEVPGVDPGDFDKQRRLRPGVTYSPTVIQSNVDVMESLALKKGLNFVMVEPRLKRNDRDGTVDVTFAIVKGQREFVERIDIEGNTTTLDSVVRRQFRTVEGDPMNPHEIAQAAERIRALGFFSDVSVTQEPGSAPDEGVVKVAVTEQPTGSISLGATYGVSSGFGISVGFSESNFLGRGQGLTVNVQTGVDNVDSQISFSEPAFLGRDLRFSTSAVYNTTNHQNNSHYDTKDMSVTPSLTFPLGDIGKLQLNYSIGRKILSNVDGPVVDDPLTPQDETSNGSSAILMREQGGETFSSVGYTYIWDDRNSALHPSNGTLLQFGQDFAGLGGTAKYIDTSFRALKETKVAHDAVTLRISFEGGALTSYGGYTTRVTDRFFGSDKIRGFEANGLGPRDLTASNQDALGGNFYAVAHLESEFPLGLPDEYNMSGGTFLDVGSVWGLKDTAGTLGPVDDSLKLRAVLGLSLFWKTPIGPLRFDFTHALKKESYDKEQTFNFNISTKF
jgi:outer membrane protein insertion porin family